MTTATLNTQHLALAFMLLTAAACGADSTRDAPPSSPSGAAQGLALGISNSSVGEGEGPEALLNFVDDSGVIYTLTRARFVLRHIELDLPNGVGCDDIRDQLAGGATCDSDDSDDRSDDSRDDSDDDSRDDSNDDSRNGEKVRIDGPFLVDLVEGTVEPSLEDVRIPELDWRRVDLRVDDADDELELDSDDPLNEMSWVMTASFELEGQPHTMEVALKFNEDIRFETREGVSTSAGSPLLVAFDVSAWLDGLPVGACIEDGDLRVEDGVVEISDDSSRGECSDFENTLKDNLKESGDLR